MIQLKKHTRYTTHGFPSCAETDPEAFFPEKGDKVHQAKAICRTCPIQSGCLLEAIANKIDDGVWGGTVERERHVIRKDSRKLLLVIANYEKELEKAKQNETIYNSKEEKEAWQTTSH